MCEIIENCFIFVWRRDLCEKLEWISDCAADNIKYRAQSRCAVQCCMMSATRTACGSPVAVRQTKTTNNERSDSVHRDGDVRCAVSADIHYSYSTTLRSVLYCTVGLLISSALQSTLSVLFALFREAVAVAARRRQRCQVFRTRRKVFRGSDAKQSVSEAGGRAFRRRTCVQNCTLL